MKESKDLNGNALALVTANHTQLVLQMTILGTQKLYGLTINSPIKFRVLSLHVVAADANFRGRGLF